MGPGLRKLVLTTHVTASVGWLGAVAVSLALAIAGVASTDWQIVRAAYMTLELIAWWVLIPLSVASLITGLVQSLGTSWGLFRHYWIVIKLAINVFATLVLLAYTQTLGHLADQAASPAAADDVERLRSPSPLLHSGLAVALLLLATVLSVYKPKGMTRYGQRKVIEQRERAQSV